MCHLTLVILRMSLFRAYRYTKEQDGAMELEVRLNDKERVTTVLPRHERKLLPETTHIIKAITGHLNQLTLGTRWVRGRGGSEVGWIVRVCHSARNTFECSYLRGSSRLEFFCYRLGDYQH